MFLVLEGYKGTIQESHLPFLPLFLIQKKLEILLSPRKFPPTIGCSRDGRFRSGLPEVCSMLKTRVNGTERPEMDAGLRRGVAAAVVLLIVCVLAVGVVSADDVTVSSFDGLQSSITGVSGDRTIIVDDNISITGQLAINSGNITLTTDGKDHTLSRDGFTDNLFIVNPGGNLTIKGSGSSNLTLDGMQQSSSGSLVNVSGNFTLADGGILTNNTADYGGGVYVHPGTFDTGGSVYVGSGTFEMSGGEISGNTASGNGGGVYLKGGTFTMSGGEISGNTVSDNGGGVSVSHGSSTFTMLGGTISGNTASNGSGVYSYGTFTMSGGEISGNTARLYGGGVYVFYGTFEMSGGEISKNTASSGGGGVYRQGGTFSLSGSGSTDSVYLASGTVITVIEELTGTENQVSGIKLADPGDGTMVVTGTPLQESDISRFKLDSSVTEYELKYQNSNIVLKQLPGPAPLPPSYSSGDGNMENAYRVLFNDGATTLTVQTDLSYGDKLTKPEDPVKDGYTFAGWHKDTACTQPWDFETGIPGDMTLYAKWTAAGSSGETEATATPTATAVTTPQPTATQTAAATTSAPEATTAAGVSPTLTQAPAPVAGALFGLLAAGVLLRRRFQ